MKRYNTKLLTLRVVFKVQVRINDQKDEKSGAGPSYWTDGRWIDDTLYWGESLELISYEPAMVM